MRAGEGGGTGDREIDIGEERERDRGETDGPMGDVCLDPVLFFFVVFFFAVCCLLVIQ